MFFFFLIFKLISLWGALEGAMAPRGSQKTTFSNQLLPASMRVPEGSGHQTQVTLSPAHCFLSHCLRYSLSLYGLGLFL